MSIHNLSRTSSFEFRVFNQILFARITDNSNNNHNNESEIKLFSREHIANARENTIA